MLCSPDAWIRFDFTGLLVDETPPQYPADEDVHRFSITIGLDDLNRFHTFTGDLEVFVRTSSWARTTTVSIASTSAHNITLATDATTILYGFFTVVLRQKSPHAACIPVKFVQLIHRGIVRTTDLPTNPDCTRAFTIMKNTPSHDQLIAWATNALHTSNFTLNDITKYDGYTSFTLWSPVLCEQAVSTPPPTHKKDTPIERMIDDLHLVFIVLLVIASCLACYIVYHVIRDRYEQTKARAATVKRIDEDIWATKVGTSEWLSRPTIKIKFAPELSTFSDV
jgi:hypothetical protein